MADHDPANSRHESGTGSDWDRDYTLDSGRGTPGLGSMAVIGGRAVAAEATQAKTPPVGDLTRLLAVVAAIPKERRLTTPEIEAVCHLMSTERDRSGAARWPRLQFGYRFRFSPTPGSDDLYDDLQQLERAGLVQSRSPVEVTDDGVKWLKDPEYKGEAERIVTDAREALNGYLLRDASLVQRSIERAARMYSPTRADTAAV